MLRCQLSAFDDSLLDIYNCFLMHAKTSLQNWAQGVIYENLLSEMMSGSPTVSSKNTLLLYAY